jgi:branched-chain amino acid aminotransferase
LFWNGAFNLISKLSLLTNNKFLQNFDIPILYCSFAELKNTLKKLQCMINYNGILQDEKSSNIINRAFNFGDGIFETILFVNKKAPLFDFHYHRLILGCNWFELEVPNKDFLLREISKTLNDEPFQSIRLNIWRSGEGKYIPSSSKIDFLIKMNVVENPTWSAIDTIVYKDILKSTTYKMPFKSLSAQYYIKAGLFASKHNLQECIIVNDKNNICEGLYSNIFIRKNNVFYSPPMSDNPTQGVMRSWIFENQAVLKIKVFDVSLTLLDLYSADEVFFTNSIHLIKSIKNIGDKNFETKETALLYQKIVDMLHN